MVTVLSVDLVFAVFVATGTPLEPYLVRRMLARLLMGKQKLVRGMSCWFSLWLHCPSLGCDH